MYNQPFFIPGYYTNMAGPMATNMMRGAVASPILGGARAASRGAGLFSKLGSGISSLRGLNWGGFINNASKTLGVVNQAIPLVKQVGPMFNNMKSILRVASVFKDETDKQPPRRNNYPNQTNSSYHNQSSNKNQYPYHHKESSHIQTKSNNNHQNEPISQTSDESPTFFIN